MSHPDCNPKSATLCLEASSSPHQKEWIRTMNVFKTIWKHWKNIGHKIGNFQARLILTFFYFVLVAPFAVIVRFGAKPLRLKICHSSNWLHIEIGAEDAMVRARRQF